MIYSITKAEKIEAVEVALAALEEDVLIACLGLGLDAATVSEDFASDDPSHADLVDALSRLSDAKDYLASVSAS